MKNVPIANQWPTASCCNELQKKQSLLSDLYVHHLLEQGVDFVHCQDFQNFSTKVPLIAVTSKLESLEVQKQNQKVQIVVESSWRLFNINVTWHLTPQHYHVCLYVKGYKRNRFPHISI